MKHVAMMVEFSEFSDNASSQRGDLRTHLNTHSGEKLNNCNESDFTSSQIGNFSTYLKTHNGKKVKQMQPM